MGKVILTLKKILNLVDTDVLGKSDPYVVFQLEQKRLCIPNKKFGKKKSTTKKGDLNPTYDEGESTADCFRRVRWSRGQGIGLLRR